MQPGNYAPASYRGVQEKDDGCTRAVSTASRRGFTAAGAPSYINPSRSVAVPRTTVKGKYKFQILIPVARRRIFVGISLT